MHNKIWYNNNQKKILNVKFSDPNKEDYFYSYMVLIKPWHSVPIKGNVIQINVENI